MNTMKQTPATDAPHVHERDKTRKLTIYKAFYVDHQSGNDKAEQLAGTFRRKDLAVDALRAFFAERFPGEKWGQAKDHGGYIQEIETDLIYTVDGAEPYED